MTEIVLGIILMLALVALQAGQRYWTVLRTRKSWEAAQEAITDGNFALAETQLVRCVKLMPLWLQPRFLLGTLLAQRGDFDAAEEQFRTARALQPREAVGHIELGIFYVTLAKRLDDGLAAFREAIAQDPAARESLRTEPRLRAFRDTPAYATLEG